MSYKFILASKEMLARIVEIYNQSIACRTVTADLTEVTVEQRQAWFDFHLEQVNYPIWVVVDTTTEEIVGWFTLSPFYGRIAYRTTAEISIYLDDKVKGKGLAGQIVTFVKDKMPEIGLQTLLAFVFKGNQASVKAFTKLGFTIWGDLPNIANMETHLESLLIMGYQFPNNDLIEND
ncbi:hypothetical protein CKF54_03000 [Psittacicella hinzii]|uniref:N-acetyltransferase domain-containing protein n=1 Tax=Psittacicella hinzii TaxID=2028575 RepID=A0A3A1Y816_9GAMM|nr:GNAT family N-acetyltransferase [Psittacicella hinzii]RIY33358.1 hypothetical protein CKF54_03000 [Psittacicella hinzii]